MEGALVRDAPPGRPLSVLESAERRTRGSDHKGESQETETAPQTQEPIARLRMPRVVSFVFLVLCGQWSTFAGLQPAKIFSDHMVLQRDAAVPLWGLANAEASVTVAFAEQSVATKADEEGRWKVELAPMKASVKGRSLEISSGGERVTIQDALVGDAWFAGGQSNMDYQVKGMASRLLEGKALADAANYPAIRHRKISEKSAVASSG